jgi:anti-sigma regulatory factor (Ser/Thr protein kinase)
VTDASIHTVLPATPSGASRARIEVSDFVRELGATPEQLNDIALVVSEAASNVARHAYRDGESGTIEVDAQLRSGELAVDIRDYGVGLEGTPVSAGLGIGMAIMRELSQSCEFVDAGPGTSVALRFRFSDAGYAPGP